MVKEVKKREVDDKAAGAGVKEDKRSVRVGMMHPQYRKNILCLFYNVR